MDNTTVSYDLIFIQQMTGGMGIHLKNRSFHTWLFNDTRNQDGLQRCDLVDNFKSAFAALLEQAKEGKKITVRILPEKNKAVIFEIEEKGKGEDEACFWSIWQVEQEWFSVLGKETKKLADYSEFANCLERLCDEISADVQEKAEFYFAQIPNLKDGLILFKKEQ